MSNRRWGRLAVYLFIVVVALAAQPSNQDGEPADGQPGNGEVPGTAPAVRLVPVNLPLDGDADTRLMQTLDRIVQDLPDRGPRPLLVLEFRGGEGAEGSRFERSLALARYLAGPRFQRVRTIAYLPETVRGHALLPILACEEIIMAPDAELGDAGVAEESVDPMMRRAYSDLSEQRRTIASALVLGMLDRRLAVYQVQLTDGGTRFVLSEERAELEQAGEIVSESTVLEAGEPGILSGVDLRQRFQVVSHLAESRRELADILRVSPDALTEKRVGDGEWDALRISVRGRLTDKTVGDILRMIGDIEDRSRPVLLLVHIDSPGGSPAAAVRLATFLSRMQPQQVFTVAYIPSEALSVASIVAFACDEIVVGPGAQLGGPGDTFLDEQDRLDLRQTVQVLASEKQRDWSLAAALIDPDLSVFRYRRQGTGEIRYLSDGERDELPAADQWEREGQVETREGLEGRTAVDLGWAQRSAEDESEVLRPYRIEGEIESAEPSWAVTVIERLASEAWFSRTLLFIAFFALISEASAPGIGVAGFVSALCFMLFFWCQFLAGNAQWLEVILFLGGVVFIIIEIFFIPGLGVFGIGGAIMLLAGVFLASQTFIVPRNTYQWDQTTDSLFTVVIGIGGVMVSIWFMRKYFPESPFFRQFVLSPPDEEVKERIAQRESLVAYQFLQGKRGVTTTQLTPGGKARFGDELIDVMSRGDLVERGRAVVVVEVRGNHVYVDPVES